MLELVDDVRTALEGLVSAEARIAATALLLLLAGLFGFLVAPWVVEQLVGLVKRRLDADADVPVDAEAVDWRVPAWAAIRTIQLGVLVGTGLALLLTWGYVGLAVATAVFLGEILPYAVRLAVTVGLFAGTYLGTNYLERRLSSYAARSSRFNQHQQGVVFRVVQVVFLVAVALATLTIWDQNPDGLLVGAGFLGIVVGMAARQTLGSLIAGFVIMLSRPFELGDWVVIDGEEGVVTDITIVNTRVKNFDDEVVVFPNDMVANAMVTNRTRHGRLRLTVDVGVDYDADLDRVERVIEEAVGGIELIRRVPKPQVVPTRFGDSAIVFEVRVWIDNPTARRRWRTRAAVIRAVKGALEREGIKIPFPQRELTGREERGGFEISGSRVTRERPGEAE